MRTPAFFAAGLIGVYFLVASALAQNAVPFSGGSGAVFTSAAGIAFGIQWLKARYQMLFAVADQICPAHGFERITQQRPVVRIVVTQKGFV